MSILILFSEPPSPIRNPNTPKMVFNLNLINFKDKLLNLNLFVIN